MTDKEEGKQKGEKEKRRKGEEKGAKKQYEERKGKESNNANCASIVVVDAGFDSSSGYILYIPVPFYRHHLCCQLPLFFHTKSSLEPLILVPVRVGLRWFGSTGLSRHNDLIHTQHRPRSFSSELDCPALGDHEIKNALFLRIQRSTP